MINEQILCKLRQDTHQYTHYGKIILSSLELIEKLIGKKAFLCPCCNSDKLTRYPCHLP